MASQDRQSNSELESFRQKWISDLRSRRESIGSASHQAEASYVASTAAPAATSQQRRPSGHFSGPGAAKRNLPVIDDDEYYLHAQSFDGPPPTSATGHLLSDAPGKGVEKPLISALDHYEEAMEKEAQGNMGESLRLYRKAYRVSSFLYAILLSASEEVKLHSLHDILTPLLARQ
jgi:F-box protein 9